MTNSCTTTIPQSHKHSKSFHDFEKEEISQLRTLLLRWYDEHRRTLPWRKAFHKGQDLQLRAYEVWISEIMLQQTQVHTVIPYFKNWMDKWPTLAALAEANEEEVRLIWKGLGYYSRASRLLESAKKLRELGDTPFPEDPASLLKLISGVGPYTAGAISSIAFNFPAPLVDGNVIRVLSRWSAMAGDPKHKLSIDYFWNAAKVLLEDERPGDWNQALMDFGATVCTPTAPNCTDCPVKSICKAYIEEHHHKGFKYNLTGDIEDCSLCQSCPVTEAVSMPRHVSFYPVKPPKKGSKCMLSIFVIIESISLEEEFQPEFLIVKRPEKGLLAGLWQFLEVDYSKQPNDKPEDIFALFFKQKFNFDDNFLSGLDLTKIDEFTHLFTHIKQYVSLFHTRFSLSNRMLFDKLVNISPLFGLTKWVSREEFNSISTCKSTQKAMEMLDTTGKPASKKVKRESPSVVSSQKNNLLKYFKNIHPIKF